MFLKKIFMQCLTCELSREIYLLTYSKYLGDGRTSFSTFRYNVDQSSYFHKYENIYNYHDKFILLLYFGIKFLQVVNKRSQNNCELIIINDYCNTNSQFLISVVIDYICKIFNKLNPTINVQCCFVATILA